MNPVKRLGLFFRRLAHLLARPVPVGKGLAIHSYRGFGTPTRVYVMGRVLRQPGSGRLTPTGKLGRDLLGILRRMLRWGVAGVAVEVSIGGSKVGMRTDEDGYFHGPIDLEQPLPADRLFLEAEFRTLGKDEAEASSRLFIAPPGTPFIVLSDIDDTVVHTGVARKAGMLWRTFMEGAESRVAFPGVAAFYRALHAGCPGKGGNPLVYVSRGPWSIYEVILAFLKVHRFPEGPVILRDWGMTLKHPLPKRGRGHKERIIREILDDFSPIPFVLIGDSGQGDPEIYAEIVHEYPGRILAVYIRNVTRTRDRDGAIEHLAREVEAAGSTLVLAETSFVMARHAADAGLIAEGALPEILQEREEGREGRS